MERITLYEEFRFIEKSEPEVNGAWKGAHLLLFFLAFVFGSFCTFCFHMLMYLFDEKCVLFPKLLSLTSLRQTIIYEFIQEDKETADMLPVDFVSTQWVEKSACLLPTYVPLVSGIFGLVWTTMFLMWSTGSRVVTGLQRPWRVLPPVFMFSLAMSSLCLYTSAVTHYGLQELCNKLSEITGSSTCTYTVNVATLAYNRRIRGVYQATRLTIFSAWLHTICWVFSTLLALTRILLAVDFKLVRISVQLQGNIDRMLEQHEKHIRTVSPDTNDSYRPYDPMNSRNKVLIHFKKKQLRSTYLGTNKNNVALKDDQGDLIYYSGLPNDPSDLSLVTTERNKLDLLSACNLLPKEHQFIVKILYDVLDTIENTQPIEITSSSSSTEASSDTSVTVVRQYGQQRIVSKSKPEIIDESEISSVSSQEAEEIALEIKRHLKLNEQFSDTNVRRRKFDESSDPTTNVTSDMKVILRKEQSTEIKEKNTDYSEPSTSKNEKKKKLKSNLKQTGIQTDEQTREKVLKVHIDSKTSVFPLESSHDAEATITKDNKETQTKKEKQE